MADTLTNLAVSAVATAPSPATSGTSLVVTAGHGARFHATDDFWATVCPAGTAPTPANSEIVRVTARSTDTLTITRAQAGTSARTIVAGDQFFQCLPAEYFLQPKVVNAVNGERPFMMSSTGVGEGVNFAFLFNRSNFLSGGLGNEAYSDDVMSWGWNIGTITGVPGVSGKVSTYATVENKYFDGTRYGSEWHREHITTAGVTHRFESYFLPHTDATGSGALVGVDIITWYNWAGTIKAVWDLTGATGSVFRGPLVIGPNSATPSDTFYVQNAAGNTGVMIKGGAAQTGPFLAVQTSGGATKFSVDQNFDTNVTGGLIVSGAASAGSLTTTGLVTGNALTLTGDRSAAAWTVNGLLIGQASAALTDTSSSGTVPAAYTNQWGGAAGGHFIAASSATTFTHYYTGYFNAAAAGTNVTLSNSWALGAVSLRVGTSNHLTVTPAGVLTATSPVFTTPTIGVAAFTQLNGGAAPTPMQIGAVISTNYSAISFNNTVTTTGINGIWGGTDGALVFNVPTGGAMYFRFANGTAYTMNATGDILGTGVLSATTATFTTPAAFPILINNVSDSTADGCVSLNNTRTRAGMCGLWGGPGGALVLNAATAGTIYFRVNNGSTMTMDASGLSFGAGAYVHLLEGAAPSGLTNAVRLFAQDNGSGKTQLMAIFGTGVAQQVAIEP